MTTAEQLRTLQELSSGPSLELCSSLRVHGGPVLVPPTARFVGDIILLNEAGSEKALPSAVYENVKVVV